MIPSWAYIGAKVVCKDNPRRILTKGKVYTISDIATCPVHGWGLAVKGRAEYWIGSYFRPLITEADDIALFKSLLNPTLVDKLDLLAERLNELAED